MRKTLLIGQLAAAAVLAVNLSAQAPGIRVTSDRAEVAFGEAFFIDIEQAVALGLRDTSAESRLRVVFDLEWKSTERKIRDGAPTEVSHYSARAFTFTDVVLDEFEFKLRVTSALPKGASLEAELPTDPFAWKPERRVMQLWKIILVAAILVAGIVTFLRRRKRPSPIEPRPEEAAHRSLAALSADLSTSTRPEVVAQKAVTLVRQLLLGRLPEVPRGASTPELLESPALQNLVSPTLATELRHYFVHAEQAGFDPQARSAARTRQVLDLAMKLVTALNDERVPQALESPR